jgi:hypothetical protein
MMRTVSMPLGVWLLLFAPAQAAADPLDYTRSTIVPGSAHAFKDTEARDFPRATTPVARKQQAGVWTLLLVLGLATPTAGYTLWANISGSLF